MRRRKRQIPFAAVGLVLIAVSMAPTAIGMVRSVSQIQRGEDATTTVNDSIAMAFHPAFIACGAIGHGLVIIGIVRAIRRADGSVG